MTIEETIIPTTPSPLPDSSGLLNPTIWDPAPDAIQNEVLLTVYQDVVAELRKDSQARGGMTLGDLLMERIAFLYIWIRDKEMSNDLANWREYRDLHKLWLEMVATYAKVIGNVDAAEMRDIILKRVLAAINSVLRNLSPEMEKELRDRFTDAFRNLDI